MQEVVPRKGLNRLYSPNEEANQSGILYRGKLICGIVSRNSTNRRLAHPEIPNEEFQSLDADFCRALSASLFTSDPSFVEFVELSHDDNQDDWLRILEGGEVDVTAGVTLDFENDIIHSSLQRTDLSGFAFFQPYFYGSDSLNVFSKG